MKAVSIYFHFLFHTTVVQQTWTEDGRFIIKHLYYTITFSLLIIIIVITQGRDFRVNSTTVAAAAATNPERKGDEREAKSHLDVQ